jgi:hypothetical protein
MSNLTRLTALTIAVLGAAMTIGASQADAATCDGSWARDGRRLEKQCYYLPTVANGRVTGVTLEQNYRHYDPKPGPGAIIGGSVGPHVYPPTGGHRGR